MPRGLKNWTYKDITAFLKEKGFVFCEQLKGSHERWKVLISENKECIVEVNYIPKSKSYPPRTLETMIRQSGIPKKEWYDWTKK